MDSLNVDLEEEIFEKLFQVKINSFFIVFVLFEVIQNADKNGEGYLTPDDFIEFFDVLARREDLFEIMQK